MRILISACLLGACCRYDGKSKECPAALELRRQRTSWCPYARAAGRPAYSAPALRARGRAGDQR
ncbi:MAG: hypothetical protein V8Q82_04285 [Christensenellales bacterium]